MLSLWELIESDLHTVYGIDVEDRALLKGRSWRWLRVRIESLLTVPPLFVVAGESVLAVPQTRLGYRMYPPGRD